MPLLTHWLFLTAFAVGRDTRARPVYGTDALAAERVTTPLDTWDIQEAIAYDRVRDS